MIRLPHTNNLVVTLHDYYYHQTSYLDIIIGIPYTVHLLFVRSTTTTFRPGVLKEYGSKDTGLGWSDIHRRISPWRLVGWAGPPSYPPKP